MNIVHENFDDVVQQYKANKTLPYRILVEEYTLFKLLGNLEGKQILDLACGEGHYTRKMKSKNAGRVIGVDISPTMIKFAERQEIEEPLGVSYICCDASKLDVLGEFDIVVGVYFLCHSESYSQLLKFSEVAFNNLRYGGKFVVIDCPNYDLPSDIFKRYGRIHEVEKNFEAGSLGLMTFFNTDGSSFKLKIRCWREEDFKRALLQAGFSKVEFKGPWLNQTCNPYPPEYWSDFIQYKGAVAIEASKE